MSNAQMTPNKDLADGFARVGALFAGDDHNIEAIYREAGEMKILPGTCHPLAGKKKSRAETEEKQQSCVAAFIE